MTDSGHGEGSPQGTEGRNVVPKASQPDPIGVARGSPGASRPAVAVEAAAQDSTTSGKRKPRRRKRRRGRKVFAAGQRPSAGAAPDGSNAAFVDVANTGQASAAHSGDMQPRGAPVREDQAANGRPTAGPFRRPPRPGDLPAYAALDLGTNNCRLLVAVPGRFGGAFRVIDAFSRIVRLGEGLSTTGRLSEAAMSRAIDALKMCADKLAAREVRRTRLIATEACRAASNGAEFLARVTEQTGLVLEVIDRETEARLAVSGCGPLVEENTDAVVLFDIGGGSSEIALVDIAQGRTPRLANHIVSWTSLPVGVVSLAERFGGRDVSRDVFDAMVDDVSAMIARFEGRDSLAARMGSSRFHLLGTSGTVTTLAGVHLGLARYDRRQVDGLWMAGSEIDAMTERLLGWDFGQRVANPCIGPDRADLVLAGCAILEAIRRAWPSQRLRVADRGLREGILSDLMERDGVWRRRRRNHSGHA